jgi:peptide/nickel transport system permease protein
MRPLDSRGARGKRASGAEEATAIRPSRPSLVRRFATHRAGLAGFLVVLFFVATGLLAPVIAPYDPLSADVLARLQPPSTQHWLGTDQLGRDTLSRMIYGAAISIRASLSVVVVGVTFGLPLGAISGFIGGSFDLLVQRAIDVIQAFPGILLMILIAALVGPSLELAVLGLGVLSIPTYARLVRAKVLEVREFAYVESARAVGCRSGRILLRHIVPNSITPVIVQSSLHAATAVLLIAGISFLGLGAQAPAPEWGAMLAQGRSFMRLAPLLVIVPAVAVSLLILGLNLVGDALRDALDPKATYGARQARSPVP